MLNIIRMNNLSANDDSCITTTEIARYLSGHDANSLDYIEIKRATRWLPAVILMLYGFLAATLFIVV